MPSVASSPSCCNCAKFRGMNATTCGFCGSSTRPTPAPASAFPMPEVACPVCDRPVSLYALGCKHCGESYEYRDSKRRARRLKDDRSLPVQLAATASFLLLFVTPYFFFAARASAAWEAWAITAGLFIVGVALATAGAVVAFRDLVDMAAGRVDTDGRNRVTFAGVVAGLAMLSHWAAAGCGVYSLL